MRYLLFLLLLISLIFGVVGCNQKKNETSKEIRLTDSELVNYRQKGGELASATQKVLGSNLIKAINEGGPVNALEFCNIQAHPLTDSMAIELQASIRRVSDQPRNPMNTADEKQLAYIESIKMKLRAGDEVNPNVSVSDGKITGYYPIITNQLCLQCHGSENEQINNKTLAKIKELYPEDQATGYDVGELRGIWVVEMDKQ